MEVHYAREVTSTTSARRDERVVVLMRGRLVVVDGTVAILENLEEFEDCWDSCKEIFFTNNANITDKAT